MSIKSTYTISRPLAIEIIKMELDNVDELSNEMLEEILESFPKSYFRNYIIGQADEGDDPDRVILDIDDWNYK